MVISAARGARAPRRSAPPRRGIDVPVDRLDGVQGAEHGAFLPAAPEGDLIAGDLQAPLRRAEDLGRALKTLVALVRPAHALELHVVPADREPVLDRLRVTVMQPLALAARDLQPLRDGLLVERDGGIAPHIGAGQDALAAQITVRG